jgi:hypothetical protein
MISAIESNLEECCRYEFLKRLGDTRGNNEVIGLVALEHSPHRFDVVGSPPPIAANRRLPRASRARLPAPILAAAAVILRVTKRLGRSGDS